MSAKETATVEIQAKANGLRAQLREIRAQFSTFADGVGGLMKRGIGAAWKAGFGKKAKGGDEGFFRGAAKTAVGNMMSSGIEKATSKIVEIGSSTLDFEEKLTRLQIQAGETPQVMRAFADSVTKASNETGIGRDKILDGANAFVTLTGDMKTAKESAGLFAKIGQATGTSIDDVAAASAAASQNLGVTSSEFEQLFDTMTGQGKAGAIELKDMAAELSTLAPQWAQFAGGKGLRGARELGAAMQVVKKGFGGDAGETTVGIQNFLTAVQKKGDRFKDLGVGSFFTKTKDGKRDLKGIFEIVDQISKKNLGKDQLVKAFGSVEAYRAYLQLRDNREELDKLSDATQYAGTIQRDFNTYMDSSSGKLAKAWENMKNAIASTFTPERIQAFAQAMEDLADKVKPVADFLGKAADALGGLSSVGKKIRGFLDNDDMGNQFGGKDAFDQQRLYLNTNSSSGWVRDDSGKAFERDSKRGQELVEIAKRELANRKGYDAAKGGIMGAEVNERSSKESINAAIDAYYGYGKNLGEKTAGRVYLRNAGFGGTGGNVDEEKLNALLQKQGAEKIGTLDDSTRQLIALLQQIATNTGAGTEVKVGADPVAKAAKNAPSNRNKVAR